MSSSRPSRIAALFLGVVAVLALPVGVGSAVFVSTVQLLPAVVVSVAAAFFFALCGISASRRARFKMERSLARKGERTVRLGRFLVQTGLYLSLVGGIALAVYLILRAYS